MFNENKNNTIAIAANAMLFRPTYAPNFVIFIFVSLVFGYGLFTQQVCILL